MKTILAIALALSIASPALAAQKHWSANSNAWYSAPKTPVIKGWATSRVRNGNFSDSVQDSYSASFGGGQ